MANILTTKGISYVSGGRGPDLQVEWTCDCNKDTGKCDFYWELKHCVAFGYPVLDYLEGVDWHMALGTTIMYKREYRTVSLDPDAVLFSGHLNFTASYGEPTQIVGGGWTHGGGGAFQKSMFLEYCFAGSDDHAVTCNFGEGEYSKPYNTRYQVEFNAFLDMSMYYNPVSHTDVVNYSMRKVQYRNKEEWVQACSGYLNKDKNSKIIDVPKVYVKPNVEFQKGTFEVSATSGNLDLPFLFDDVDRNRVECYGGVSIPVIPPPPIAETIINGADNFNDEENPHIYFSNEQMRNIKRMEVGILDASQEGEEIIIVPFRNIPLPANEYIFNFTDEERDALRRSCLDSKSKLVKYVIKTYFDIEQYETFAVKTLSIINSDIVLNPVIEDVNPISLALTGDKNTFIKGISTAAFKLNVETKKFATLVGTKIKNYATSSTLQEGEIPKVESKDFLITALDSRGNLAKQTVTKPLVEYQKLSCNFKGGGSLEGRIKFHVDGYYFNGSFGAVDNTLEIKYRYKTSGTDFGPWTPLEYVLDKNTYSASGIIEGLDYRKTYTFQVEAKDKIETISIPNKIIKTLPVYDWSEYDFNFNVPVRVENSTVVSTTKQEKGIIYSGIEGNMYIRPSGEDSDYNQLHLSDAGIDINGNTIVESNLTVKGNLNVDQEFLLQDLTIANQLNVNGVLNANGGINSIGDISLGTDYGIAFKNGNTLISKYENLVKVREGVEHELLDTSNSFFFLGAGITSASAANHPVIIDDKLCRMYMLVLNNPSISPNDFTVTFVRKDILDFSKSKTIGCFLGQNEWIKIQIEDKKVTLGQSSKGFSFRLYGVR